MEARRYDTRTSRQEEVSLHFSKASLTLLSDHEAETFGIDTLRFSDRLGNMPRSIYLPDGSVCETRENDAVDAFLRLNNRDKSNRLLHYLESKLRYVVAAVVTTILFTYGFIVYGLPATAEHVAQKIPAPVVYNIGNGTLKTLDKVLLKPTHLPLERQKQLESYFKSYIGTTDEWPKINVAFRSGALGPNALALPNGTIVFTDALVELAENDDELLSIFFHELGHVERRHALRTVLQDSAFFLLVSAITGDATAASSLLAALPTMLVESNYSREMEVESDNYAYELMQRHGIDHAHFANIMERLLEKMPTDETTLKYLNSHPQTLSRIEKFRNGQ